MISKEKLDELRQQGIFPYSRATSLASVFIIVLLTIPFKLFKFGINIELVNKLTSYLLVTSALTCFLVFLSILLQSKLLINLSFVNFDLNRLSPIKNLKVISIIKRALIVTSKIIICSMLSYVCFYLVSLPLLKALQLSSEQLFIWLPKVSNQIKLYAVIFLIIFVICAVITSKLVFIYKYRESNKN